MIYKVAENDNYRLEIHTDEHPQTPRDWDNLGTMVCFHHRYGLGDKHCYDTVYDFLYDLASRIAVEEEIEGKTEEQLYNLISYHYVILPLYLYDHSGITMSTNSFSCPWDSGQVGWIYCDNDALIKEYGVANEETKQIAMEVIKGEVKAYDQYLQGDTYGFIAYEKKTCECCNHTEYEEINSCWGFYGNDFDTNGIIDYVPDDCVELVGKLEYA